MTKKNPKKVIEQIILKKPGGTIRAKKNQQKYKNMLQYILSKTIVQLLEF